MKGEATVTRKSKRKKSNILGRRHRPNMCRARVQMIRGADGSLPQPHANTYSPTSNFHRHFATISDREFAQLVCKLAGCSFEGLLKETIYPLVQYSVCIHQTHMTSTSQAAMDPAVATLIENSKKEASRYKSYLHPMRKLELWLYGRNASASWSLPFLAPSQTTAPTPSPLLQLPHELLLKIAADLSPAPHVLTRHFPTNTDPHRHRHNQVDRSRPLCKSPAS